jgi:uncharacterized damage-inducible protein DinB
MSGDRPEVWLRGPIPGVPPLLQPVAHALLQAAEEVEAVTRDFPAELLWTRPAGVASVGFHLQHLAGVVDRLFTYARGAQLNDRQRTALAREGTPADSAAGVPELVLAFRAQVDRALAELRELDQSELTRAREVGRAKLPSTTLGLLFHAAEHTQRHVGQLFVTIRVLKAELPPS